MSSILPLMLFSSEKELFSWTYLLKKKTRWTKILISPVWNKILKIWDTFFELIQIEIECIKSYFKVFFYHKKLEFLEITYKKERKSHTQNFKKYFIIYLQRIFAPVFFRKYSCLKYEKPPVFVNTSLLLAPPSLFQTSILYYFCNFRTKIQYLNVLFKCHFACFVYVKTGHCKLASGVAFFSNY